MRLVGVPGLARRVDRRHASDSSSTAVSARRICLITPRVSPVARDTRRSTERVDRPSTSPCTAADATGSCTSRPARTSRSTKTSALSGPGSSHADPSSQNDVVVAGGKRQRPVDQLARQQGRHERAEAELDAEELGVLRDRHGRCPRLGPSHRQPSRAPLPRDDHLPVDRRHRDERRLGFTSCPPRLVDEAASSTIAGRTRTARRRVS